MRDYVDIIEEMDREIKRLIRRIALNSLFAWNWEYKINEAFHDGQHWMSLWHRIANIGR